MLGKMNYFPSLYESFIVCHILILGIKMVPLSDGIILKMPCSTLCVGIQGNSFWMYKQSSDTIVCLCWNKYLIILILYRNIYGIINIFGMFLITQKDPNFHRPHTLKKYSAKTSYCRHLLAALNEQILKFCPTSIFCIKNPTETQLLNLFAYVKRKKRSAV